MSFGKAVATCFSKYATFTGRASRSEYWFFVLFMLLSLLAAVLVDYAAGTRFSSDAGEEPYGTFYVLVILTLILPSIAVAVRRLHDTDRSGWWYWICLIPLVGSIVLLVWFCSEGTIGENRFGLDPLAELRSTGANKESARGGEVKIERLLKLKELFDAGSITESEFERLKAEVLGVAAH